jgi:hypothetical protein
MAGTPPVLDRFGAVLSWVAVGRYCRPARQRDGLVRGLVPGGGGGCRAVTVTAKYSRLIPMVNQRDCLRFSALPDDAAGVTTDGAGRGDFPHSAA